jgi:putative nucleotidyltransferase with HDIG domain
VQETATAIVRRLRDAGHAAYFAGGCVRDMVRGVKPHDFDIATSARPEEVQKIFPNTIAVGAQFGVVLVLEAGHQFEIATFRSDEAYIDGRRPSGVRYASPLQDAQRRDFTIKGLVYDPLATTDGAPGGRGLPGVIDYVDGVGDIERAVIRCIGEPRQRFSEDKLRLLRAVRFAANLGFEIEPETFAVVRDMAGQISIVSAERIREELIKIFTRANAGRGLELLDVTGLLRELLPEVAAMRGVEQPPEFHPEGDVFTHTKMMLDLMSGDAGPSEMVSHVETASRIVLAFAVLLHDVGKPPTFERAPDRIRFNEHDKVGAELTERIMRRLRFPNETIEKAVICVAEHMRFQFVREMRPAKLKRILARETFPEELELHRLDCESSHRNLDNYEFLRRKAAELPAEVLKPAPLITGHDMLEMGLKPGPLVGQILRETAEAQLEERLNSREEALEFARRRVADLT